MPGHAGEERHDELGQVDDRQQEGVEQEELEDVLHEEDVKQDDLEDDQEEEELDQAWG